MRADSRSCFPFIYELCYANNTKTYRVRIADKLSTVYPSFPEAVQAASKLLASKGPHANQIAKQTCSH